MRCHRTLLFSVMVITGLLIFTAFSSKIPVFSDLSVTTSGVAYAAGHGAPNGPHYNLNIIGVPRDKTADMTGNQGHRIFVKLWGNSTIWLAEGDDFQVLDANGTDKDGAKFQLPDPDPDDDLVSEYSVFVRTLGPGGQATMTTCYETGSERICSLETLTLKRDKKGAPKFTNVSKTLFTVFVDTDGDGVGDTRMGIFDNKAYQYLWDYNNQGLKLAQLRFYPVTTDMGD